MASIRRTNKQTLLTRALFGKVNKPGARGQTGSMRKKGVAADLSLNGGQVTHRDSGLGSALAREDPEPSYLRAEPGNHSPPWVLVAGNFISLAL